MLLSKLFKGAPDLEIEQLSIDSRLSMKNAIFFCLDGIKYDGHDYIEEAIKNGAKVIVYSKEQEQKFKAIYIKVSPKELQTIRERMESVGIQNLSAYMLKMAMNGFIIQLDMSDMKEVLRLMKINSNNLNQYAKKANETGSIYKEDIKELMVIHKELIQMLGEILERLGSIE